MSLRCVSAGEPARNQEIVWIACHRGPADHFATYTQALRQRGLTVKVWATGPALQKLQERKIKDVTSFDLEGTTELVVAEDLAKKCAQVAVVITDVGHSFDIALQKALAVHAPLAQRVAYYDNPEPYVPGGYFQVAAEVMLLANKVLFANADFETSPLYAQPSQAVVLEGIKKIGLGFYPISKAEEIKGRRKEEKETIRASLFQQCGLKDQGQKFLVYIGGNNQDYFSKAFPAFLRFAREAVEKTDLSNYIVVLQQHPGAKEKDEDIKLLHQWLDKQDQEGLSSHFIVSRMSSDDAQVVADAILYYQTSMSPQFVLAGIPTIQVGHEVYPDLLVKNGLCAVATDVDGLIKALENISVTEDDAAIRKALGLHENWADLLERALTGGE